ncbi:MAG: hypothetical protein JXA83_01650 [Acidimicrobiales bacterium]|nr:hypothetical protein [Acidimicrobiales bacterium]
MAIPGTDPHAAPGPPGHRAGADEGVAALAEALLVPCRDEAYGFVYVDP